MYEGLPPLPPETLALIDQHSVGARDHLDHLVKSFRDDVLSLNVDPNVAALMFAAAAVNYARPAQLAEIAGYALARLAVLPDPLPPEFGMPELQ